MFWITDARRIGVILAALCAFAACAQAPLAELAADEATEKALRPYLGTWRPTSFAEQQNIGSLTLSLDGLSAENGKYLKYRLERQTEQGVVLQVIQGAGNISPDTGALALAIETVTINSPDIPPKPSIQRQILRIYWCARLEQLAGSFDKGSCSKNGYTR